ncbi:flagellar filament capping protein FliD [Rhodohalobacter sp. 8-1]|uniref:flagellar filament capping protein FliD n=1 Tax=Rhodohalobacter sp. 8-1 TaxID=3131972 RepID=UPI0030EE7642
MNSVQSLFRQNNPYESFVQQLTQIESRQKLLFEDQQKDQKARKTALGDVSEAISKFVSKIDEFQNPGNTGFQPIKISSSDESVVSMNSADGLDRPSDYNIQVDRLASNDIGLGQIMDGEAFDLAAQGAGSVTMTIGDKTETLSITTQKEDENGVMVDMNNREVLDVFATAISETFGAEASASVFNVSGTDVQFSIRSSKSGSEGAFTLSGATGVLAGVTDPMTKLVPDAANLDAQFTIDGVTFLRSENTVSDAITGLSFTLRGESTGNVQMSAQRDLESSRETIDDFMASFNDMNKIIRERSFINSDSNTRGPLRNFRSIRNLTLDLRQTGLLQTDSADPNTLSRLTEIGIGFENDGKMVVEDEELLNDALSTRPEEIAALFRSEDSAIAKMKTQAEAFTKSGGIISSLESGVDQKISRLDTRIAREERFLEDFEERQRAIFNKLQQVIDQGDAQFQRVMAYRNSVGF